MRTRPSRRSVLKAAGAALALPVVATHSAQAVARQTMPKPRFEGEGTPKIALEVNLGTSSGAADAAAAARRITQLGVSHVLSGGPRIPWDETQLRQTMGD